MDQRDHTELCNLAAIDRRDLKAALRDVTRASARVLNVRRVGFWTFRHRDELHCEVLFDAGVQRFHQGARLRASESPVYFEALRFEQLIIARNAHQDPRTRELTPRYLAPLDIRSMLDVPVWVRGQLSGVLCHEQVGSERHWSRRDTSFAMAAANAIAAALEARDRIVAEGEAERAGFLSRATALLFDDLDADVIPRKLTRLAVPFLADWCILGSIEGQRLELVGEGHPDGVAPELLRSLCETFFPIDLRGPSPAAQVVRTREPLLLPVLDEESVRHHVENDRQRVALLALGATSLLALPLVAKGEVLGSLLLLGGSHRYDDPRVVALAEDLASRATVALQNARLYRRAALAIRHRDEFLSVASHELNTPIASLQLSVEGLEAGALGATRSFERVLPIVLRQVHRLARLVQDLLDVSRIDTEQLQLKLEPVDLVALVREVATQLRPDLERARCPFSLLAPPELVGCWDRARLEQVVTNLIGNALKFGAGAPIEVALESRGACAVLEVGDHGVGIAPERQADIFGRFERAVSSRAYGGLGLGLYIVSALVAAHHGDISVSSTPGEGAHFTVQLPLGGSPCESPP